LQPIGPAMRLKGWQFFFLILTTIGLIAALFPLFFNIGRQTHVNSIEIAQARWSRLAPSTYGFLLRISKTTPNFAPGREGPSQVRINVRVREGKVVQAEMDGRFIKPDGEKKWDMEGVFDHLNLLSRIGCAGDYLAADFHPGDGHPMHWVHSVKSGPEAHREEGDLVLEILQGFTSTENELETQGHTDE